MDILRVGNLTKCFGDFLVVKDVSLTFEQNKITALIGPNGAGKTTFLRLLSGELSPTKGKILWQGKDITSLSFARKALVGISRCFQVAYVFNSLSVIDNLRVAARGVGLNTKEADQSADALLEKMGLLSIRDNIVDSLPYGNKRIVELCMSIIQQPELLLCDEVAAGLSHAEIELVDKLIREEGNSRTIIIVEHRLEFVFGICDRVVVMHNGEIIADGTADEVRNNQKVRQVYWGE